MTYRICSSLEPFLEPARPVTRSPFARALSALDPTVHYLNHGAFGACPRVVQDAQRQIRELLEHNPVHFFMRELERRLAETRGILGPFLGANPDDLGFVPNATTGVNTVLSALEFEAGAEIVITDHTYPACRNAVQYWAGRRGLQTRIAKLPFPVSSPEELTRAILAEVTPLTKLVLLDHITSPSGLIMPLESLVGTLHERGIDTLVDGAHGPGMLPLDLDGLGAAYYTGNLHKWCCAPKGAAFLWVRRDRQALIHPLVISHGWAAPRSDRSRFLLEFDWPGTLDPSAILSVPTALDFLASLFPGGMPDLYAHNHALALHGRDSLCAALGTLPPSPDAILGSLAVALFPVQTPKVPTPDELYNDLVATRVAPKVPIVPRPSRAALRLRAHRSASVQLRV